MLVAPIQLNLLLEEDTRPLGTAGLKKESSVFEENISKPNGHGNPEVLPSTPPTMLEVATLGAWIKSGKHRRFTALEEEITPGMAAQMLSFNVHNRPQSGKKVESYADLIRRGLWKLTGEMIIFDSNGVLQDGQHRLMAIYISGIPTKLDLIFGNDPEAFPAIDQGKVRTSADICSINGYGNARHRAALALALLELEKAPATRQDVAVKVSELDTKIDKAVAWAGRLSFMTNPAAISLAYFTIQEGGAPTEAIDHFFASFWDVKDLAESGTIRGAAFKLGRVRSRLLSELLGLQDLDDDKKVRTRKTMDLRRHILSHGYGREYTHLRAAAIILAWNAYRQDRRTVVLAWDKKSELPKPAK
jgi:hypothetical protein